MAMNSVLKSTRAWIRANKSWLTPNHSPMTTSLLVLAKTMDTEQVENGKVSGSVATAYRMGFRTLLEMAPKESVAKISAEDDLLSPS